MDDVVRRHTTRASGWEPTIGAGGRVEISINYWHINGRYCSDSVHLPRYIELLKAGLLKWQREKGLAQPEHNPDLSVAEMLLKQEEAYRSGDTLVPCGWRTSKDRHPPTSEHATRGRKQSALLTDVGEGELVVLDDDQNHEEDLPSELDALAGPEEDEPELESASDVAARELYGRYETTIDALVGSFGWALVKKPGRLAVLVKKMGIGEQAVEAFLRTNHALSQRFYK